MVPLIDLATSGLATAQRIANRRTRNCRSEAPSLQPAIRGLANPDFVRKPFLEHHRRPVTASREWQQQQELAALPCPCSGGLPTARTATPNTEICTVWPARAVVRLELCAGGGSEMQTSLLLQMTLWQDARTPNRYRRRVWLRPVERRPPPGNASFHFPPARSRLRLRNPCLGACETGLVSRTAVDQSPQHRSGGSDRPPAARRRMPRGLPWCRMAAVEM